MIKIFVGGLPAEVSELELVMFISLHAHINSIKIVRDKLTQKSKGYAFLEMLNPTEANNAVATLNGQRFKGNTLTVKLAEEKPEHKAPFNSKPIVDQQVNKPLKKKRPRIQQA